MMPMARISRHRALPFMEVKAGEDSSYSIRQHSHTTLSLGFVEKGSSRIHCSALAFDLVIHQAILIPPDVIHLCRPKDPEMFKFKMLFVDPDWLEKTFGLKAIALKARTASLTPEDQALKSEFFTCFEPGVDRFSDESLAIGFVSRMLFTTFGIKTAKENAPPGENNIFQAKIFMDDHFTENIQLEDLEKICGLNKFSILRQFKKNWQLTPHAYLLNKRINLAATLLLENKSIADTAAACGFFDQSHFVKTFKSYTGVNPGEYKHPSKA